MWATGSQFTPTPVLPHSEGLPQTQGSETKGRAASVVSCWTRDVLSMGTKLFSLQRIKDTAGVYENATPGGDSPTSCHLC